MFNTEYETNMTDLSANRHQHIIEAAVSTLAEHGIVEFTFNKVAQGVAIGDSLFDEEGAKLVPEIMRKAAAKGVTIHLPSDFVAADKFDKDAASRVVSAAAGALRLNALAAPVPPPALGSLVLMRSSASSIRCAQP